jgi:hypothetical protein
VQCTTVFPDTAWSRLGVDYSGLTLEQYKSDLRQHVETALSAMHPDWLSVFNEPMTQKMNTGLDFTPAAVKELVNAVITGLNRGSTLIGAGAGTWDEFSFAQALATTSLDFLDMHIYPINATMFIDRAVTFAQIAKQAGKRIAISECWLYKVRDSEVGNSTATAPYYYARDVFDFWIPLDITFLDAMVRFAQWIEADLCSFFWIRNFYGYLQYDASKALMTPTQLFALCDVEAGKNILTNTLSQTGVAYKNLIAQYATTVESPGAPSDAGIILFPQPARGRVSVVAPFPFESTMLISDALGRIRLRLPMHSATPGQPMTFDISSLPPGVYFLRSNGAGHTRLQPLLVR